MKHNYAVIIIITLFLTACGGGTSPLNATNTSNTGNSGNTTATGNGGNSTTTGNGGGSTTTGNGGNTTPTDVLTTRTLQQGDVVTSLSIDNAANVDATYIPVTFGQVFAPGEVPAGNYIAVREAGNNTVTLPYQLDVKATHADGSLRHAVISTRIPALAAGGSQDIELILSDAQTNITSSPVQLSDILGSTFDATVSLTESNVNYTASAKDMLASTTPRQWLSGPYVSEWVVSGALKDGTGNKHPHLAARFYVRAYSGLQDVRVDVVIENDWAFEPSPRNFDYDVSINVCGTNRYQKSAMTHYHHARWRKTFWCGSKPDIHIKHDTAYLIASGAIPNYDQMLTIPETELAALEAGWTGSKTEPMGIGLATRDMPAPGAHNDIGPFPTWSAMYILSQDYRAKSVTLGTASLAGSWSMHYRDKNTGLPVTLTDYPYMSLLANPGDMYNPATQQSEAFPACGGDCSTPYTFDSAHQPSFGYLSYIVTGDLYYLEELQFWANYNILEGNPYYRDFEKGLVKWDQERGQAWSMRTLGQTAYITPDNDPLKGYFTQRLLDNLDWYNTQYINGPETNALGIITNGHTLEYNSYRGIAPWQDDFFTWAIGYLVELGFSDASQLLDYKAQFPVSLMTDPGFCWLFASSYSLNVRDSNTSPLYTTWAEVYNNNFDPGLTSLTCDSQEMAIYRGAQIGEMDGYPSEPTGYPSNLQPALAVSANSGIANAMTAWQTFDSRSIKPDYSSFPVFAIIPR